ncbi:hypothetical protein BDB00DRAFT_930121 [Zychaea mexicana]|uniref:uncharacterized protein n=1 Tax=Zychaea mexicana TaxID=64656 RepID=UPI0022FEA956|nr:uncharacterized protein BDB00DRAFT_930121 [Zychaea mexicana]KAI9491868.1 hypothetical protein BDB00DRAFT_930121 [Zychaea mexicana]
MSWPASQQIKISIFLISVIFCTACRLLNVSISKQHTHYTTMIMKQRIIHVDDIGATLIDCVDGFGSGLECRCIDNAETSGSAVGNNVSQGIEDRICMALYRRGKALRRSRSCLMFAGIGRLPQCY